MRYDPRRPAVAVLQPGPTLSALWGYVLGSAGLLFLGFLLLIS